MRQIVFILILITSMQIFATQKKLAATYEWQKVTEELTLTSRTSENIYTNHQVGLNYSISSLANWIDLQAGIVTTFTDYSKVYLRQGPAQNGEERAIEQDSKYKKEYDGSLMAAVSNNVWRFQHSLSYPLHQKYFKTSTNTDTIERKFWDGAMLLSYSYTWAKVERPLSYYSNPVTTELTANETKLNKKNHSLYYEQFLSETWKLALALGHAESTEERPENFSYAPSVAHAWNDWVFSKFKYSYTRESTSKALKNSRGYFTNNTYSAELVLEPIYEFLFTLSYDLIVEYEVDPRVDAETRVALDQYGIGVDYTWGAWKALTKVALIQSNVNSEIFLASGGIEWNF